MSTVLRAPLISPVGTARLSASPALPHHFFSGPKLGPFLLCRIIPETVSVGFPSLSASSSCVQGLNERFPRFGSKKKIFSGPPLYLRCSWNVPRLPTSAFCNSRINFDADFNHKICVTLSAAGVACPSHRRKNIRRSFGRGHDLGEGNGLVSAQNEPDPIRDAQFLVDAMQMNFHRAFCDPKLFCDNFICEPLRYQPGYFRFPSRQLRHSTLPIKLPRTTARTE